MVSCPRRSRQPMIALMMVATTPLSERLRQFAGSAVPLGTNADGPFFSTYTDRKFHDLVVELGMIYEQSQSAFLGLMTRIGASVMAADVDEATRAAAQMAAHLPAAQQQSRTAAIAVQLLMARWFGRNALPQKHHGDVTATCLHCRQQTSLRHPPVSGSALHPYVRWSCPACGSTTTTLISRASALALRARLSA